MTHCVVSRAGDGTRASGTTDGERRPSAMERRSRELVRRTGAVCYLSQRAVVEMDAVLLVRAHVLEHSVAMVVVGPCELADPEGRASAERAHLLADDRRVRERFSRLLVHPS